MRLSQAQIARLKQLEGPRGHLTARIVLNDAKKPKSPLHTLFKWDLKHAAERWWLHRAQLIIGAVTMQVTHHHEVLKTAAYVVDRSIKGGGYRSTIAIREDPEAARESLIYTLETAAGHLRRAYDLSVPLGLSDQIDRLLAQIAGVARIVQKKKAA